MEQLCPCGVKFNAYHNSHRYHSPACRPRYGSSRSGARSAMGLGARAVTLSAKRSGPVMLRMLKRDSPEPYWRPTTRGECALVERPCCFCGCRHNLFLDTTHTGSIKLNHPDRDPTEMEKSCALDEAGNEGMTLEQVGIALNITRERTRQIEVAAIAKVRQAVERMERAS